jgi:hypothetical protein
LPKINKGAFRQKYFHSEAKRTSIDMHS